MKGVVPKLCFLCVFSLFCPASVTPCPLFHFSCPLPWMSSGVPPAFQGFYYAQYPGKNVLPLFAGMVGCPGSAHCQMSSSSWVCPIGGSRRRKLHCHCVQLSHQRGLKSLTLQEISRYYSFPVLNKACVKDGVLSAWLFTSKTTGFVKLWLLGLLSRSVVLCSHLFD